MDDKRLRTSLREGIRHHHEGRRRTEDYAPQEAPGHQSFRLRYLRLPSHHVCACSIVRPYFDFEVGPRAQRMASKQSLTNKQTARQRSLFQLVFLFLDPTSTHLPKCLVMSETRTQFTGQPRTSHFPSPICHHEPASPTAPLFSDLLGIPQHFRPPPLFADASVASTNTILFPSHNHNNLVLDVFKDDLLRGHNRD